MHRERVGDGHGHFERREFRCEIAALPHDGIFCDFDARCVGPAHSVVVVKRDPTLCRERLHLSAGTKDKHDLDVERLQHRHVLQ